MLIPCELAPVSPFLEGGGPRRSAEEIASWARATYGVALVPGFGQLRDARGATENAVRVASFIEFGRGTAWYVNMGGQAPASKPDDAVTGFATYATRTAAEARSVEWSTAALPEDLSGSVAAVFVFSMGLGNGSPLPQPSGWFDLHCNGRKLLAFRTSKYRQGWRAAPASEGAGAQLLFDVHRLEAAPPGQALWLDAVTGPESWAAYGLGLLYVPLAAGVLQAGAPAVLRVTPHSRAPSTRWFKLDDARDTLFQTNFYPGLAEVCTSERSRTSAADGAIYFGDLHTHTGEPDGKGCGTGTVEENYDYARDVGALDFYCLSEHDKQIRSGSDWERLLSFCDAYDAPGRFATIPGYEFTNRSWGHRDVYFASTRFNGRPPPYTPAQVRDAKASERFFPPEHLWARLDESGMDGHALTVPHHPSCASHPFQWQRFNPRYDRLVEIYSSWGSAETPGNRYQGAGSDRYPQHFVRPQWDRGLRFGVIASSDGHDGCPGDAQSPHAKHHHIYHPLGSGRAAVIAPDLSRESVFAALHARRCYATTGAPIALEVRCNDRPMGSSLTSVEAGRHPRLDVRVTTPFALARLEIVRGRSPTSAGDCGDPGHVVYRQPCDDDPTSIAFSWLDPSSDTVTGTYYYVRAVQRDDEMAWSSPHWIETEGIT